MSESENPTELQRASVASRPAASGKGRLQAIAILVGVFLFGGVAGAGAMRAGMLHRWSDTFRSPPGKARAGIRLDAMQRHLDLSDAQRARVGTILDQTEEERERLMAGHRPAMDALRDRTDAQIRAVLGPEQQIKHEEMMRKMRERGHRGGHHDHGHHPPPP